MTEPGNKPLYETIRLDRHGIIEASAGTGKTFTIENLVVRILCEKDSALRADIDQILLLTYTEKATGELQQRIRSKITQELDDIGSGSDEELLLQTALRRFDHAAIHTIHGFCQRVLQQYPFETDQPYNLQVVDNRGLNERALHRIMRWDWSVKYGDYLQDLLILSGYTASTPGWETSVLELADRYRPEAGNRLLPDEINDLTERLAACKKLVNEIVPDILEQARKINFIDHKGRLNNPAILRKKEMAASLEKFLMAGAAGESRLVTAMELLRVCLPYKTTRQDFSQQGFACLFKPDKDAAYPAGGLDQFAGKLDQLPVSMIGNLWEASVQHHLTVETVRALKEKGWQYKQEHGLVSYDDMLARLNQALGNSEPLVAALRSRYRYALVDEFQDTDPIQWNILKRIFLSGKGQRIFLIGDPKQAIYGFRGADVATYYEAVRDLQKIGRQPERLATNWRSVPDLIHALNRFFGACKPQGTDAGPEPVTAETWFGQGETGYGDVSHPDEKNIKTRIVHDSTEREDVVILDLGPLTNRELAIKQTAAWIAAEISHLLEPEKNTGGSKFIFRKDDNDQNHDLQADDICILIRNAYESGPIEEALRLEGIPHSFYRKAGLYRSQQATHLHYLFDAIARPADNQALKKALLTPFFRVSLDDLWMYEELPPEHPVKDLLQRWQGLAANHAWAILFQSVLEDTGIMLVREDPGRQAAVAADRERNITNYQHILQVLETEARQQHLDFVGIQERLERYRRYSVEMDQEADVHRLETEKPKVQIMTIHKSKGLQRPIVFLATGFKKGTHRDSFHKYHLQGTTAVYDCSGDNGGRAKREIEEEEQRLYYVAMTRAMYKLYVPKKSPDTGKKGPSYEGILGTRIHTMMKRAWIKEQDPGRPVPRIPGLTVLSTPPEKTEPKKPGLVKRIRPMMTVGNLPDDPIPGNHEYLRRRADLVSSFSALKARSVYPEKGPSKTDPDSLPEGRVRFLTEGRRDKDTDEALPGDSLTPDPPVVEAAQPEPASGPDQGFPQGLLPRGTRVGNILHLVLERVDFQEVRRAGSWQELLGEGTGTGTLVEESMTRYDLREKQDREHALYPTYGEQITRIVWNTLHTRFAVKGIREKSFRLADLPSRHDRGATNQVPAQRIHELEFIYPLPGSSPGELQGRPRPEWIEEQGLQLVDNDFTKTGFLKGFIDLVFRVRESSTSGWRYCLLDWKSNWIPGSDYHAEAMAACMAEHNYHLQYRLYTIALARWLQASGVIRSTRAEDFSPHFGGVFYLFLRGLDPSNPGAGVYCPQTLPDPEGCEEELFFLLNNKQGGHAG